jgi:ubiquinone/menaquinone biosynthesis C-methylase UbiE
MNSELKSFDRVAHCYDETRGLPPDVERQIGAGIAALLRDVAPAPRLLEVGIGTGRIAVPTAAAGVRVTGIDISSKMLALLREKRRDIDVMLAEAARPPLRDASFDGALFVHILHLVPDAEATLRATLPLVRPAGLVIQGGDDRLGSVRDKADEVIRRAVQEVAGIDIANRDRHAEAAAVFERVMADAGARMRQVTLARWTARARGRRMLERLASQDYSSSWLIPKEALAAIIERVTPLLDVLYGGLDREIEFERGFTVTAGALPG